MAAYVDMDYSKLVLLSTIDPVNTYVAVQNADGSFFRTTLASVITTSQTQVIKTTPGDVNVAKIDGSIIINKTVGQATAVNLPVAADKFGAVLVTDLKRDAGTNPITIFPVAGETIAGLASYQIAADGASVFLRPVPGVGYVI